MKQQLFAIAISAISVTAATASHAVTFVYQLGDHPDRGQDNFAYGLRLDRENDRDASTDDLRFFSFDNGGDVTLTYDSTAGTALISGDAVLSLGGGVFGDTFQIEYTLTGLTDLGNGGFVDTIGNGGGAVTGPGGIELDLFSAAKSGNPYDGEFFRFGPDELSDRPFTGFEGTGWVDSGPGLGANDFLFTAVIAPVPLPAAAWMLLAGLGGLGAMRRRQTKS